MPLKNRNKCAWKIPSTNNNTCDKPCYYDMCKRHRKLLREGHRLPTLCRSCKEIVTHSETFLCKNCKGNFVQQKMLKKEKRQKELKEELNLEILKAVPRINGNEKIPSVSKNKKIPNANKHKKYLYF